MISNYISKRVCVYCLVLLILGIRMAHYRGFTPINESVSVTTSILITSTQKRLCEDLNTGYTYLYSTFNELEEHGVYTVSGHVMPPEPQRNPGVFSSYNFYENKHIKGTLKIKTITFSHYQHSLFNMFITTIHNRVLAVYQQLPSPYYELFTGLIIGDQKVKMPHHYKLQFVRTGLIHLIVVSGAQVSLLTGILTFLCNAIGLYGGIRFLLITGMSIVFYFITGGGPSILRAVLMNCIALSMAYSSFKTRLVYKLLFLLLVHFCLCPGLFWDIGAQLSYITTLTMIFFVPLLKNKIVEVYTFPEYLSELLAITVAPFILTTPLLLYHFKSISLVSLLSNLIVPPLLEWLVTLGIIITPFGLIIKELAIPFLNGFKVLIYIMLMVMDALDSLSFAMLYTEGISLLTLAFLYVLILNLFFNKSYSRTVITVSICVVFFVFFLNSVFQKKYLELYFLDVGQGDCTVIITPHKKVIVIDAGPADRYKVAAETVILPFLHSKGINQIDCMIITHYDLDHYGGLEYLVDTIPIPLLIDNGSIKGISIKEKIRLSHVKTVGEHDVLSFDDGVSLLFLNVPADSSYSENNKSLVFQVVYKDFECLFTGDLEEEGERIAYDTYGSQLASDVYKVGHHGSKTSSTLPFLSAVQPAVSIISAGINNRYHHPAKSVVSRLQNSNSIVEQTLLNGAILMKTDGISCYYRTFLLATPD